MIFIYTTPHAKQRFLERVKYNGLPKKTKQRNKFIEDYIKKAYKFGLIPTKIEDQYLRHYMTSKIKSTSHGIKCDKITCYNNNIFLFRGAKCITILSMPEKATNSINNSIYVNKLQPFINSLNENKIVKKWLHENSKNIQVNTNLKKCNINYNDKFTYLYIIDRFPIKCIQYINNASKLKRIIIDTHTRRNETIKDEYYFICALLLLFPQKQVELIQNALYKFPNNVFKKYSYNYISKKKLSVCYKQLVILKEELFEPKFNNFDINENQCLHLINDYLIQVIPAYIDIAKYLFTKI